MADTERYNIIVADDVADVRLLIVEMISPVTNNVYEAENGKEVINILLKHSDIDIILTDIEMPEMNGLDTSEYIRRKLNAPKSKTPIIAITAYHSTPFAERCKKLGIDEVISKPFSDEEIIRAIKSLVRK